MPNIFSIYDWIYSLLITAILYGKLTKNKCYHLHSLFFPCCPWLKSTDLLLFFGSWVMTSQGILRGYILHVNDTNQLSQYLVFLFVHLWTQLQSREKSLCILMYCWIVTVSWRQTLYLPANDGWTIKSPLSQHPVVLPPVRDHQSDRNQVWHQYITKTKTN